MSVSFMHPLHKHVLCGYLCLLYNKKQVIKFIYTNNGWCVTKFGYQTFNGIINMITIDKSNEYLEFELKRISKISSKIIDIYKIHLNNIKEPPDMKIGDLIIVEFRNEPYICKFGCYDEDSKYIFSFGHCEIFANVLKEIYPQNIELKTLKNKNKRIHVFGVLTSNNQKCYDIMGERTIKDIMDTYDHNSTTDFSIEEYVDWPEICVWEYIQKFCNRQKWSPLYRYIESIIPMILKM